jgi:hypothetical protein
MWEQPELVVPVVRVIVALPLLQQLVVPVVLRALVARVTLEVWSPIMQQQELF